MKLIPIVLACVVGVAAAAPSCDCIDNKSKPPKACPYPPYPPPPPPHGKPPPPPPPRPVCEEENPPRDPLPPPSLNGKCTPATYSCAANPKTGEAGWQLCNTSGQYEYGGDCPPNTVCKFFEPSKSPYCVPPNYNFP